MTPDVSELASAAAGTARPRTVFQLRLSPEQLERWQRAAADRGEPLSVLVRRAVEEELEPAWEAAFAERAGGVVPGG